MNVRALVTDISSDLKKISINTCVCSPVALQLILRGLFPCAPQVLTLTVDVNLLHFIRELFVRLSPNNSAFCATLEAFLGEHNYKLSTKESLRRHFGNVLLWYSNLINATSHTIQSCIEASRANLLNMDDRSRPSKYLRVPNFLICLDVCFTQKRRKGKGDECDLPRQHPDSVFISHEDVQEMEDYVEECRPSHPATASASGDDDGYEGMLTILKSVLDGCQDSFLATVEKREKASMQFFVDTGLMALLCHHDRVLWLVNMTLVGERQHYALTLIQCFFEHLPISAVIGVLYDIACQLHRSCVKWGFLQDFSNRILFVISIFHAYGHQWPCQVIYHPRKCVGFGLTDGEGCEHFWSAIKILILSLHISGYHQWLFTIDTQVKHLDEQSLRSLEHWLGRKWASCRSKRMAAEEELDKCKVRTDILCKQWAEQIKQQTRPMLKRSNNKAKEMIENIIVLQKVLDNHKATVHELEQRLMGDIDLLTISELNRTVVTQAITRKKAALSIDDHARLTALANNSILQICMNARTLKLCIRERLPQRKFELEWLERSYRQTINNRKLTSHMESAVKRREPGILKLTKTYNKLCKDLSDLTKAPRPIETNVLFKLNVDDDIWQDIGLDDEVESGPVPPWLGDEKVRVGIKNLLLVDRCKEEEARLQEKRCAMQKWLMEQWNCLEHASGDAGDDEDLKYQLDLWRHHLCNLCMTWQGQVCFIPCAREMPASWDPSQEQLHDAAVYQVTGAWDEIDDDSTTKE
ncbi:uncharacterized protein LAESUDRAFT_737664 [Laetiporus sulphureus 93-53]|uniref:CxC1-like cysteine cluster associated with KDZ transposases domain-containing protein n=1 Tax=Laetiporus sulphureus 93-53 TaxID=1314785 RepID=A0A165DLB7_9APHY|nr:uncharacterized protein LAESUDRAFT_737664 [Laetiporus sulphureus 93-53]KZT05136.1 hypothetical protein LAESUDRAFT_737664 [Laetiporus sulphureus 93-53]